MGQQWKPGSVLTLKGTPYCQRGVLNGHQPSTHTIQKIQETEMRWPFTAPTSSFQLGHASVLRGLTFLFNAW